MDYIVLYYGDMIAWINEFFESYGQNRFFLKKKPLIDLESANMTDAHLTIIHAPNEESIVINQEEKSWLNIDSPVIMFGNDISRDLEISLYTSGIDLYFDRNCNKTEVFARIRNLIKKSRAFAGRTSLGNLIVDHNKYRILVNDHDLYLSYRQYRILSLLIDNRNHVLSKDIIIDAISLNDNYPTENALYIHISRIHKKLKEHRADISIEFVRDVGYTIKSLI